MPKLYQIILDRLGIASLKKKEAVKEALPKRAEEKIYNPLAAKIGRPIDINELDYKDKYYNLIEMHEYSVEFQEQKKQKFTDYVLFTNGLDNNGNQLNEYVKIRVTPHERSRRAILMEQYDEMPYNQDFHNILKGIDKDPDTPDFRLDDINADYYRLNDEKEPYKAIVKLLCDDNSDGRIGKGETTKENIEFWDFGRTTNIDGIDEQELVFVEMNTDSGFTRVWKGREISLSNLQAI